MGSTGSGKTAIRLGGGIAYDIIRMDIHENTSSVAPFRITVIQSFAGPVRCRSTIHTRTYPGGNPYPYNYNPKNPMFFPALPYQGFLPIDPNLKTSAQYTWNFGIQRQVTSNLFVSAYLRGNRDRPHLDRRRFESGDLASGKARDRESFQAAQFGQCAALQANCGGNAENFRRLLEISNPIARRT